MAWLQACAAVRRQFALADVDPKWRLEKSRERIIGVAFVVGLVACLMVLAWLPRPDVELMTKVTVGTMGTLFLSSAGILSRVPRSMHRVFELVEWATWTLVPALAGCYGLTAEPRDIVRHRSFLNNFYIALVPPIALGMRPVPYMTLASITCVLHSLALYRAELHYGTEFRQSFVITNFMYSLCFFCLVLSLGKQFRSFQLAEDSLRQEKLASQSLVTMLCDAWCVIDPDGDTVQQADGRFDAIMGRNMVGNRLSQAVAGEDDSRQEQVAVFRKAIMQLQNKDEECLARKGAAVPLTLRGYGGNHVSMTLFVVAHKTSVVKEGIGYSFLVGFCQSVEQEHVDADDCELPGNLRPLVAGAGSEHTRVDSTEWPDSNAIEPGRAASLASTDVFRLNAELDSNVVLNQIMQLGRREHWLIDYQDLHVGREGTLGSGKQGCVIAASFYGADVVLKVVSREPSTSRLKCLASLCGELRILRHCRHPNLVQLHGAVCDTQNKQLALVLERASGGDLGAWMERSPPPSEDARFRIMTGICSALWYLHSNQPAIVHGDLKSQNVLLVSDGRDDTARLADFGLASIAQFDEDLLEHKGRFGGTIRWVAPEVLRRQIPVHPGSDIFSYGRMLQYLASMIVPHAGVPAIEVKAQLRRSHVEPFRWPSPTTALHDFVEPLSSACLAVDWKTRPSAATLHWQLERLPLSDILDDVQPPCGGSRLVSNCERSVMAL